VPREFLAGSRMLRADMLSCNHANYRNLSDSRGEPVGIGTRAIESHSA
jgi:hypothetical protein